MGRWDGGRGNGLVLALVGAGVLLVIGCGSHGSSQPDARPAADASAGAIQLEILAINDFHGNLDSPGAVSTPSGNQPAGGVDYLAAQLAAASLGPDSTIIVSAGDLIGGSPLISALFHDEPTIEAMNDLGLAINCLGNHELDEDVAELHRMIDGGCHPVDGCFGGDGFDGASFSFLSANAVDTTTGDPIVPPYEIRTLDGVDIGFIGLTTVNTPAQTTPITGVTFLDEAATANQYVAELQGMGVDNIVVVIHEGGSTVGGGANDCNGLHGRIVGIVNALDPAVDLVLSGHTHQLYNCVVNDIPVSSAGALGLYYTAATLTVDPDTKLITSVAIDNRPVLHDVTADSTITALVDEYRTLSAPLENQEVGQITGDLTRTTSAAGESTLGDVVADAMLAATPGSAVAFQQRGGLRADLLYAASGGETMDGQVRYGELFSVQPFQNLVVTMTLTGQQIHDLLEEQWTTGINPLLQVSSSMSYTWHAGSQPGDRVDPAEVLINGVPLDVGADYVVTTNNFLSPGGAGYSVFTQGTNVQTKIVDIDALVDYVKTSSPLDPPALGRITLAP